MSQQAKELKALENTAMLNLLNHLKASFDQMIEKVPALMKSFKPDQAMALVTQYRETIEPVLYNFIGAVAMADLEADLFLLWIDELEKALREPAKNLEGYLEFCMDKLKEWFRKAFKQASGAKEGNLWAAVNKAAGLVDLLHTQTIVTPMSERSGERKDELS